VDVQVVKLQQRLAARREKNARKAFTTLDQEFEKVFHQIETTTDKKITSKLDSINAQEKEELRVLHAKDGLDANQLAAAAKRINARFETRRAQVQADVRRQVSVRMR